MVVVLEWKVVMVVEQEMAEKERTPFTWGNKTTPTYLYMYMYIVSANFTANHFAEKIFIIQLMILKFSIFKPSILP